MEGNEGISTKENQNTFIKVTDETPEKFLPTVV